MYKGTDSRSTNVTKADIKRAHQTHCYSEVWRDNKGLTQGTTKV